MDSRMRGKPGWDERVCFISAIMLDWWDVLRDSASMVPKLDNCMGNLVVIKIRHIETHLGNTIALSQTVCWHSHVSICETETEPQNITQPALRQTGDKDRRKKMLIGCEGYSRVEGISEIAACTVHELILVGIPSA